MTTDDVDNRDVAPTDRTEMSTQPGYSGDVPAASMPAPVTGVPSSFPRPAAGRRDGGPCQAQIWPSWADRWTTCGWPVRDGECVKYHHRAAAAGVAPTGDALPGSAAPCGCRIRRSDYTVVLCPEHEAEVVAPSVAPDSDQLRDEIEDVLVQVVGTQMPRGKVWRPGPVVNALLSGPLQQLRREHAERGEALERVRAIAEALVSVSEQHLGDEPSQIDQVMCAIGTDLRRALDGGA